LNNDYGTFAALSHTIYQAIFQPIGLPKGRVVVCPDNFLIPFETLCTDSAGRNFLLYDYTFDYVYSARYLLKSFNNPVGKGNFLGLAPTSFAAYLHVPDLQQSVTSIQTAASCYSSHSCMTGKGANRRYFMEEASGYSIVNVYSHARADSGENEPLLFMSDSVIHLSELQLLQHPSAQLVVLSACQTNAGRNAAGEGVYSLARGFASAGIPAVASTLWQADEQSTYEITEQFHRYLSQGMPKDEALQNAKWQFIRKGGKENLLPYYWANMILIGNAGPVNLSYDHHYWWIALALLSLLYLLAVLLRRAYPRTKI
jgi:CHAT domain-containing protein